MNMVADIELNPITFCKYELKISNKKIRLSFPQLLDLRNRVNEKTVHHSLEEIIDTDNFVLLFLADREHLVLLDIPQLVNLNLTINAFFYNSNPVLI